MALCPVDIINSVCVANFASSPRYLSNQYTQGSAYHTTKAPRLINKSKVKIKFSVRKLMTVVERIYITRANWGDDPLLCFVRPCHLG
jgi:hypothetical protein